MLVTVSHVDAPPTRSLFNVVSKYIAPTAYVGLLAVANWPAFITLLPVIEVKLALDPAIVKVQAKPATALKIRHIA